MHISMRLGRHRRSTSTGPSCIVAGLLIVTLYACRPDRDPGSQYVSNQLTQTDIAVVLSLDWIARDSSGDSFEFADARGLALDERGRTFVLDGVDKVVHVFDSAGSFVRTIGGEGAGPGELSEPIGLAVDPGGRLWVADAGNVRYNVYDSTGVAMDEYGRHLGAGMPWPGHFDSSGLLYDVGITPTQDGGWTYAVRRFNPSDDSNEAGDSIEILAPGDEMFEVPGTGWKAWVPFTSRFVYDIDPTGFVWFAQTGIYEMVKVSLTGDTIVRVALDRQAVPVSDQELQRVVEELSSMGVALPPQTIPDRQPYFESLHVVSGGGVWVYPYTEDRPLGTIVDMFSPGGSYLGTARTEGMAINFMAPPVVRDDLVYAVVIDDLYRPSVARLRATPSLPF